MVFDEAIDAPIFGELDADTVIDLDTALIELEDIDSIKSQIIELHFFGGLKFVEIAKVLEITPKTVQRKWKAARCWLAATMSPKKK